MYKDLHFLPNLHVCALAAIQSKTIYEYVEILGLIKNFAHALGKVRSYPEL